MRDTPPTPTPDAPAPGAALNQALVQLCTSILPVWERHLATSRQQAEAAVAQMLSAFAEIGPHINLATRQSHQMNVALSQGAGDISTLAQSCQHELSPLLETANEQGRAAIERVITMIRRSVDALQQVATPLEHETEVVGEHVERMYVGFQYQDRINQMMTLLQEDIARLRSVLEQPETHPAALERTAWLARLESNYAMAEQRHNHVPSSRGESAAAGDSDETVFF